MADSPAQLRRVVGRLRARGFTVVEVPGWETRGRGPMTTRARVEHHTAGPAAGDAPSLRTVTFGRADLRNSLSRWFVARSGTIYLVALGLSWHAGAGNLVTNATASGTEAEHSGRASEPWPAPSLAAQRAISQEECAEFGVPHSRVFDHREHTSRKIGRISIDSAAWRRSLSEVAAANQEEDPVIGLRQGDEGEAVKALQVLVRNAGADPGPIDGVYGEQTNEAATAVRQSVGSGVSSTPRITGWAYAQIMTALARRQGGGEVSTSELDGRFAPRGHDHTATVRLE